MKKSLAASFAAGALAVGLAVPAAVSIAGAESGPSAPTTTAVGQAPTAGAGQHQLVAEVAAEAGISTEKLQSAIDAVRLKHLTTRLDRAVTNGRITQAQADTIITNAKNGQWPARRGLGRRGNGRGGNGEGGAGLGQIGGN